MPMVLPLASDMHHDEREVAERETPEKAVIGVRREEQTLGRPVLGNYRCFPGRYGHVPVLDAEVLRGAALSCLDTVGPLGPDQAVREVVLSVGEDGLFFGLALERYSFVASMVVELPGVTGDFYAVAVDGTTWGRLRLMAFLLGYVLFLSRSGAEELDDALVLAPDALVSRLRASVRRSVFGCLVLDHDSCRSLLENLEVAPLSSCHGGQQWARQSDVTWAADQLGLKGRVVEPWAGAPTV